MALSVCAALFVAGTPQAASAGTRTMQGTVGCTSGVSPLGFNVSINGAGPGSSGAFLYPPTYGTSLRQYTMTIPTDTVVVEIDSWCAYTVNEYYYGSEWPYGAWQGYAYYVDAGNGNVTADYVCSRSPWLYGQWVRSCSRSSISYS